MAAGQLERKGIRGMLRMRRDGIVRGVATIAVALCGMAGSVSAVSARAGEYHVYGCRMPDGSVAPTDGWIESSLGTAASAQDTCASGGALIAALGDGATHEVETDHATWIFSAQN